MIVVIAVRMMRRPATHSLIHNLYADHLTHLSTSVWEKGHCFEIMQQLKWAEAMTWVWYISFATASASALPVGAAFFKSCSSYLLPIWLMFHGVISLLYYGNAFYLCLVIPHEVKKLRYEYAMLLDTGREISHSLGHTNGYRFDNIPENDFGGPFEERSERKINISVYEWISVVFALVYAISIVTGTLIVAIIGFCLQWVVVYGICLCVITAAVFLLRFCRECSTNS